MKTIWMALLLSMALIGAELGAQGGQAPGDGPGRCWNCIIHTGTDGVNYNLCKFGELVGSGACIGGGSGTTSVCTTAGDCPETEAQFLALGMLSNNGLSTNSIRFTLARVERRGVRPYSSLHARIRENDCKGFVSSLIERDTQPPVIPSSASHL